MTCICRRDSDVDTDSSPITSWLIVSMTREVAARHVESIVEISGKIELASWQRWEPANVMMELPRKWEFSLLLLHNSSVVGFLVASVYRSNIVHIHQLAVIREFRGNGGATGLVKRLIELSRDRRMKALTLETPPDAAAAQRIYASLSFEIIDDVVSLDRYLVDKQKAKRQTKYYPANQRGIRVWQMELERIEP